MWLVATILKLCKYIVRTSETEGHLRPVFEKKNPASFPIRCGTSNPSFGDVGTKTRGRGARGVTTLTCFIDRPRFLTVPLGYPAVEYSVTGNFNQAALIAFEERYN